jgi:glycosyltransferase involved in cell wall biosynthesis
MNQPDLSIILCVYNPRQDILERVLDALRGQTLTRERWELIVVDNNSNPPLKLSMFNSWQSLPVRLIRERQAGVPLARSRGIAAAGADLLLMLDDDNILDADYLATAVEIARDNPSIGAFGGISRPLLETGSPQSWQEKLYPYIAVRDYGTTPIVSNEDERGEWEPIGAGMVVRADVANRFAQYVRSNRVAASIDRRGKKLLSGYDSLLARCCYPLGYANSYQPRLKLTHYIKPQRMKISYMIRLLHGHGRSFVMLNTILGKRSDPLAFRDLIKRFFYRREKDGLAGTICWAWDLGYFLECRANRSSMRT